MIGAKYHSLRAGIVDALAALVDDEMSPLHRRHEEAIAVMRELLYTNPAAVHHIPLETASGERTPS